MSPHFSMEFLYQLVLNNFDPTKVFHKEEQILHLFLGDGLSCPFCSCFGRSTIAELKGMIDKLRQTFQVDEVVVHLYQEMKEHHKVLEVDEKHYEELAPRSWSSFAPDPCKIVLCVPGLTWKWDLSR